MPKTDKTLYVRACKYCGRLVTGEARRFLSLCPHCGAGARTFTKDAEPIRRSVPGCLAIAEEVPL